MEDSGSDVAVAGATGRTGRLVVAELLKRGYPVRALVRSAARAADVGQSGATVVEADLASAASLEQAVAGCRAAVSALGSKKPFSGKENNLVDNLGIQNLARAALAAHLQHLVVISSIGVGDSKLAVKFIFRLLMGPVLRKKALSEAFVKDCGIPYTIIRPGGLSDKELSGKIAFGEGGRISGMVSRRDIARACVDALENPAMKNRVFEAVDATTVPEALQPHVISL